MKHEKTVISKGLHILDGATGTSLIEVGMPRMCCQEKWILDNPQPLIDLQKRYAAAGSEIIYAPTFQANELALERYGLASEVEDINKRLVDISRAATPDCLIAGNVTTLRGHIDTSDEKNFSLMLSVYRRQMQALADCGVSIIAAETLLHPLEANAAITAAKEAGISDIFISFALKSDGTLRSGHDAAKELPKLESMGAAAIGVNCIAADELLPPLIKKLKLCTSLPVICKPNTGRAINGIRPVGIDMFAEIMQKCIENGATIVGGCCGTTPDHIVALSHVVSMLKEDLTF